MSSVLVVVRGWGGKLFGGRCSCVIVLFGLRRGWRDYIPVCDGVAACLLARSLWLQFDKTTDCIRLREEARTLVSAES